MPCFYGADFYAFFANRAFRHIAGRPADTLETPRDFPRHMHEIPKGYAAAGTAKAYLQEFMVIFRPNT